MHILITNDDGYSSPGIAVLAEGIRRRGWRATIVAPSNHMSGASRSRLSGVQLSWQRGQPISGFPTFLVDGTPAACVVFAITSGIIDPVDLCISGINAGENLGAGLTISGTFGAALEAISYGVRAIAISRQYESYDSKPNSWDWSWVEESSINAVSNLIHYPVEWKLANINLPNNVIDPLPIYTKICRQSYFYDRYDTKDSCIMSAIGYKPELVETNDDINVFALMRRVSISLLSGEIV